ncbi:MAG: flagellar biosynthesis anti-sigma factor FlgM [Acidocella sp. 20-61-6]|nr:MAG: flagellar biosynthesis anti-sigma factor FlgM [Acidocella sp. 20-61-6]
MTNVINTGLSNQAISNAPVSTNTANNGRPATAPNTGQLAATSEAVTVSAGAQITTQLLGAARTATGVNTAAVMQIRSSIQNGTYNITPENLANAMAAALKDKTS